MKNKKIKKENPAEQYEKCLDISDRFDLMFTEKLSLPIAKMFCKLDASPNFVTVLGGVFGIIGALLIAFSNLICTILGILFIILYAIFDAADGQVARMSHKGNLYGRCLDGTVDSVVYFAIYLAIGFRLMFTNIPFTDALWYGWIFLIIVPFGVIIHAGQSRMADYYRNAHMYLSASDRGNELSNSIDMKKITEETPKGFKRFVFKSYTSYTIAQERATPKMQKLLGLIRFDGGRIPFEVSKYYRKESNKIARWANALVFNVRTYTLFVLLLISDILSLTGVSNFGWEFLIFPLVLLTLEPLKIWLTIKYEKICANATDLMQGILDERKEKGI